MKYGEPIEAVGTEVAAGRAQLNAQIAESSAAVRAAALNALKASGGSAKGVTVAEASRKGVMLRAEDAKTVTYFSIPAPTVDPQNFNACIDRLIAYMQVENDELLIRLGVERLDQNKASFDARHKAQLKKIDEQIATMRADEAASTLTKIFKWIGVGIAIAATAIAATVATIFTFGAASPSYGVVAMVAFALVTSVGATVVSGLDAGGVFDKVKDRMTRENMRKGMNRTEAAKKASDFISRVTLGVAIANAVIQITAAVATGGATTSGAVQAVQALVGVLQGLQTIGAGVADLNKAKTEFNLAKASAEVKRADARLREVKEFLNQNMEEIEVLVEQMEQHFQAYRAIVVSKASSLLSLAGNI